MDVMPFFKVVSLAFKEGKRAPVASCILDINDGETLVRPELKTLNAIKRKKKKLSDLIKVDGPNLKSVLKIG